MSEEDFLDKFPTQPSDAEKTKGDPSSTSNEAADVVPDDVRGSHVEKERRTKGHLENSDTCQKPKSTLSEASRETSTSSPVSSSSPRAHKSSSHKSSHKSSSHKSSSSSHKPSSSKTSSDPDLSSPKSSSSSHKSSSSSHKSSCKSSSSHKPSSKTSLDPDLSSPKSFSSSHKSSHKSSHNSSHKSTHKSSHNSSHKSSHKSSEKSEKSCSKSSSNEKQISSDKVEQSGNRNDKTVNSGKRQLENGHANSAITEVDKTIAISGNDKSVFTGKPQSSGKSSSDLIKKIDDGFDRIMKEYGLTFGKKSDDKKKEGRKKEKKSGGKTEEIKSGKDKRVKTPEKDQKLSKKREEWTKESRKEEKNKSSTSEPKPAVETEEEKKEREARRRKYEEDQRKLLDEKRRKVIEKLKAVKGRDAEKQKDKTKRMEEEVKKKVEEKIVKEKQKAKETEEDKSKRKKKEENLMNEYMRFQRELEKRGGKKIQQKSSSPKFRDINEITKEIHRYSRRMDEEEEEELSDEEVEEEQSSTSGKKSTFTFDLSGGTRYTFLTPGSEEQKKLLDLLKQKTEEINGILGTGDVAAGPKNDVSQTASPAKTPTKPAPPPMIIGAQIRIIAPTTPGKNDGESVQEVATSQAPAGEWSSVSIVSGAQKKLIASEGVSDATTSETNKKTTPIPAATVPLVVTTSSTRATIPEARNLISSLNTGGPTLSATSQPANLFATKLSAASTPSVLTPGVVLQASPVGAAPIICPSFAVSNFVDSADFGASGLKPVIRTFSRRTPLKPAVMTTLSSAALTTTLPATPLANVMPTLSLLTPPTAQTPIDVTVTTDPQTMDPSDELKMSRVSRMSQ